MINKMDDWMKLIPRQMVIAHSILFFFYKNFSMGIMFRMDAHDYNHVKLIICEMYPKLRNINVHYIWGNYN